MNWYKIAVEESGRPTNLQEIKLPTVAEITSILRNHKLVKNIGKVKNAYIIGSFAKGTQNEHSDVDVLLEIVPIKNYSAEEYTEKKRALIQEHFMKNNIWGPDDSVHPQWNGRRIDLYFTYDASLETRPKTQLPQS